VEAIMARTKQPFSLPAPAFALSKARPMRHEAQRFQAAVTIPRALLYMTLVGLASLLLWLTLRVDLVIFAGVLLAISLRRAAEGLGRAIRLPVGWALLIVILLILAFFAGIGWFFSQAIASQIDQLTQQLPVAAEKVGNMIGQSGFGKLLMRHLDLGDVQTSPTSVLDSFFGVAINVAEVVGAVVVILFLGIYFAAEAGRYAGGLVRLVPPARRSRAADVLHETASAIWYWMLGRLFSMTVLGVLTALGLWVLGVPLPIALGFLAGIMTFVPYIGSIASAIPSVLIAASINLGLAVYVVALYLGIHLTEGYILVPPVQRRVVHLPPALTLSAQVVLGVLAGFLGLLLATPLVAAALVIIHMVYVEDVLGERGIAEPAPFK
jgi:predicted PurR-regulated permease PerM